MKIIDFVSKTLVGFLFTTIMVLFLSLPSYLFDFTLKMNIVNDSIFKSILIHSITTVVILIAVAAVVGVLLMLYDLGDAIYKLTNTIKDDNND